MKKQRTSESGLFNLRVLAAFALCSAGVMLFGLAANPSSVGRAARTPTHLPSDFAFSNPVELVKSPYSQIFFQEDGEPEIHVDLYGTIYVTAIRSEEHTSELQSRVDIS